MNANGREYQITPDAMASITSQATLVQKDGPATRARYTAAHWRDR